MSASVGEVEICIHEIGKVTAVASVDGWKFDSAIVQLSGSNYPPTDVCRWFFIAGKNWFTAVANLEAQTADELELRDWKVK